MPLCLHTLGSRITCIARTSTSGLLVHPLPRVWRECMHLLKKPSFHGDAACVRRQLSRVQGGSNNSVPHFKDGSLGGSETLVDLSEILTEARSLGGNDLIFEDFDPNEPPWEPPAERELPQQTPVPEAPKPPPVPEQNPLIIPSAYSPEQGFQELSVHQVQSKIEGCEVALILDVREPYELEEEGTIAGALNIPLGEVSAAARAGKLDEYRAQPIVVICAKGIRSAQATVRLTKVLGFEDVSNMQGGFGAWVNAGLPIQRIS